MSVELYLCGLKIYGIDTVVNRRTSLINELYPNRHLTCAHAWKAGSQALELLINVVLVFL